MNSKRKIKVLVVDDSLIFRETLVKALETDPFIEVVGTAADPYEARDKILQFEPDVMTLDVEMPKMNGIEFLKRLIPQYPMPVVVVSIDKDIAFAALNAGAVDFVAKSNEALINELILKIKIASTVKVGAAKAEGKINSDKKNVIIAIGASTGGTEAIFTIIKKLPKEVPGIVIVQHMPPMFTRLYADRLNSECELEVKEAQPLDKVLPGRVLIAPGDYHMKLKKFGGDFLVDCFHGEKVNGHCPSVDVLFESVAYQAGKNAIGVILTGMGNDGAKGLLAMRKRGARTIGQNEQSCVVYGMPKIAYNIGAVEQQASLESIPDIICSLAT